MLDLNSVFLTPGYHVQQDGFCLLEAAAAYSGLEWTDEPETVNADIARLLRAVNDWTAIDTDRQELKQLIPLITQTGSFSQHVHEIVDRYFHFNEEQDAFDFQMPTDPIALVNELVDWVTFEQDMVETPELTFSR